MRATRMWVTVLLCGMVTLGCSADPTGAPTGSTPAPAGPTATQPSPPASATPSPPTKAEAAAKLKAALVTPKDLGKPWVQPKAVSRVKAKKGEVCPGHVSLTRDVATLGEESVNLTEGKGVGKNIATFDLSMLADEDGSALAAAYQADQKACASFKDGSGFFVVRSAEGPETVDGAEPVSAWAERIYYDKGHKKLAYARHYLVVRQGAVVTFASYAFLTVKKDPKARDFTRLSRLLDKQLDKNATVFS